MYPFLPNTEAVSLNLSELLLNRTWRPPLSVTGINGLPSVENAGNVSIPKLTPMLSMRLPSTVDGEKTSTALKAIL
ncbi:hypothetical protein [Coxiella endosymbiont of Ornithodoros amblus]|uniref:hypothetical protein n=1 Tax=Coxiella endosymbiont of Ornithodoros amblus TaxID=1656166 RepID=UPI00244E35C8|nr:hypothetical protein [Coxiella endosymbiont of Ornithodoros amblus]